MATPSRASSRSPERQPHTPTRSSPRSSPKRTPLLERSDSQKNAPYRKSPFPTLPSQVFPPKGDTYIFGDEPYSSRGSPTIPPRSPKRPPLSSGNVSISSALEGSIHGGSTRNPDVTPLLGGALPSTQGSPRKSDENNGSSHVRRRTLGSASKSTSITPLEAASVSTGVDTGESSQMGAQRGFAVPRPQERQHSTESFAARTRHQKESSEPSLGAIAPHKSIERLRSQSSQMSKQRKRSQTGQSGSPRSSDERPRSSSSPSTPTDAFIKALIQSGANVQYPKLRKPSATSLRSESIPTVGAYPPPLRLQRKRANSQLAKAASIAQESLEPTSDEPSGSIREENLLRPHPSQASFLTHTSDASTSGWDIPAYAINNNLWRDELNDTVTELHPRSLKRQRSDYQESIASRLEQPSRESLRSSVGSFYHFLNDSRTAWAQVYYRGEGKLRLETPPQVEDVEFWQETPGRPRRSTSPANYSPSPGATGFPERIHVPRVRPLRRDMPFGDRFRIRHVPAAESSSSSHGRSETDSSILPPPPPAGQNSSSSPHATSGTDSSTLPGMGTFYNSSSSPYNAAASSSGRGPRMVFGPSQEYSIPNGDSSTLPVIHPSEDRDFSFAPTEAGTTVSALPEMSMVDDHRSALTSPVFNPTPAVPHLSPSTRVGPWLPYWRAPSFDESSSPFDKSNVQLILFCVGFLLPPVWWIAAFLPLPRRPQWERQKTPARIYHEHSVDLFDSIDVYRFQKAQWWRNLNRFMAVVGVLIVAAVIACVVVSTT